MHISRLPNEVLVDVFARLDCDSVESVQLVNRRFNAVVRRHKLYRPTAETIKFASCTESDGHRLTVTATLAPRNGQIREKTISCFLPKEADDRQVNENVKEIIKQLHLNRTKSIDLMDVVGVEFDIFGVMKRANIGLEELETCFTPFPLQTPFVTKEFMDKLVARNLYRICFHNCTTQLQFVDILGYMKNNLNQTSRSLNWQFGFCDTSGWSFNSVWQEIYRIGIRIGPIHAKESSFYLKNSKFNFQHSN